MEKTELRIKHPLYVKYVKRLIDIVLSLMAILVLSPVLLVIVILELIYHGQPVLYAQDRPGLNGEIFKLYKFRSMNNKKDAQGNLLPGKDRVTKFGRILRRLSLDELPELFCILTGKMSIIGPRPLLVEYLPYYTERHQKRHMVKPGLAIVSHKPIKTWTWNDQFENDLWYVENVSLLVDIKMVFAVAKEALVGSDYRVNDTRDKITADYWKDA